MLRTERDWMAGAVVVAVLVGVVGGLAPSAFIPLLGLLLLVLAVAWPAAGVICAVPVLLFSSTIAQYPALELAQYGDEAAIALLAVATAIRWLIRPQRFVFVSVFGWIAAFLCLGLVSGVIADVP